MKRTLTNFKERRNVQIGGLIWSLAIMLAAILACGPSPRPADNSTPPANREASGPTHSPTPTPTAKVEYPPPDVQITSVDVAGNAPDYNLVVTMRNNGPTDAHLSGGCGWKCPVFPESAGASTFISGELLGKDRERSFSSTRAATCALPLQVTCKVQVRSWVDGEKGSEPKPLEWSGQLQTPPQP